MLITFRNALINNAARRLFRSNICDEVLTIAPMSSIKYQLISSQNYEEIVKKSKFSCVASPVKTVSEAEAVIRDFRDPQATNTCWAYVVEGCERYSDDGEPSGTAGRPMMGAIHSENVTDAVVAINRYFGGIKLGTGGLSRAFGGITRTCIQQAPKVLKAYRCTATIITNFEFSPQLHRVLRRPGNTVVFHSEEALETEGSPESGTASLRLIFSVDAARKAEIVEQLQDACKGAIKLDFSDMK
jgi:putative IMPACT (imprinted ancient) family translation regulator